MDLLGIICLIFFGLLLLGAIVNGLWHLVLRIFKNPPNTPPAAPVGTRTTQRRSCLDCGDRLPAARWVCLGCRYNNEAAFKELDDLEATERQLRRFAERATLSRETLDRLTNLIDATRKDLRHPRRAAQPAADLEPVAPPRVPASIEAASALDRLEELLRRQRQLGGLSPADRIQVILHYRKCDDADLDKLPPASALDLMEILQAAGLADAALHLCERLLALYPDHPLTARAAVLGATLARQRGQEELAITWCRLVLKPDRGTREEQNRARQLLEELEPAVLPLKPVQRTPSPPILLPSKSGEPSHIQTPPAAVAKESGEKVPSSPARPVGSPSRGGPATPQVSPVPARLAGPPSRGGPPAPTVPARPRRTWAELLGAFMEEKNILWGELLGGLLIVGGSIALVISLWHTLERNPYFPFGIFGAVTAALFGAGLYTFHHWKLDATSRGLLVIACLLTPLNFLVMPGMLEPSGGDAVSGVNVFQGVIAIAGLVAFAGLVYLAGGVLVPAGRWLLPLAVLGCSAAQLIIGHRLAGTAPPALTILLLGLLPAVCHGLGTLLPLRTLARSDPFDRDRVWSLLFLLGIATFAVIVAYGFLALRCDQLGAALQALATLQALSSVPILLGGVLLHQRLTNRPDLADLRTVGTGMLLGGAGLMLLALPLAWPDRPALLLVCVVNALTLTWVGFRRALPWLHAPALLCLLFGYLLLLKLPALDGAPLQVLGERWASLALLPLAGVLAGMGEMLVRVRLRPAAAIYAAVGGLVAVLSLGMAGWQGPAHPERAALVHAVIAASVLVVNRRWQLAWLNYAGLIAVTAAVLWGLHWQAPDAYPLWSAVLAVEALLMVSGLVFAPRAPVSTSSEAAAQPAPAPASPGAPLIHVAEGTAWLAVVIGVLSGLADGVLSGRAEPWHGAHVFCGLVLVAFHLLLTLVERQAILARLTGYLIVGTTLAGWGWLGTTLDVTNLSAVLALGLALTCLGLAVARVLLSGKSLFVSAWADPLALAALLALWLCFRAPTVFEDQGAPLTLVALTAAAWLTAWLHRQPFWTWAGAVLLIPALGLHLLSYGLLPGRLAVYTLLGQATALIVAGLVLRRAGAATPVTLETVLAALFRQAGLAASLLAAPLLLLDHRSTPFTAGSSAWLALLWLTLSWLTVRPWLFAASQFATVLAVLYATTWYLWSQEWVQAWPAGGLWDPRSLQSYTLGLAGLALAWVIARIALQKNTTAERLLLPNRPGIDRRLLWALVLGQMGLVDWAVLPGVLAELIPQGWQIEVGWWPAAHVHAWGPGAWWVVAALALVAVVGLWQPGPGARRREAVLHLLLLALTVPVLCAATWDSRLATASALRWELAAAFVVGVALIVARREKQASGGREPPETLSGGLRPPFSQVVRRLLLDAALLPVLVLTGVLLTQCIVGAWPTGSDPATWFAALGPPLSTALPLLLLAIGLTALALRESLPSYAFAAGWLVTGASLALYALHLLPQQPWFEEQHWVTLLLLGTLVASAWALLCLFSQRWASLWRSDTSQARGLLDLQVAVPGIVFLGVLVIALGGILLTMPSASRLPSSAPEWTRASGDWLGWVTLLVLVPAAYLQRSRLDTVAVGLLGLVLAVLGACTVEALAPGWGYRGLLTTLALFVLLWAGLPWLSALGEKRDLFHPPLTLAICGLLTVLGLKAAVLHHDHLWASGAIALAALCAGAVCLRRQDEPGMLFSGLGLNLAASLLTWHFHSPEPLGNWWAQLLQVNALASSGLLLVFLGLLRGRGFAGKLFGQHSPALAIQLILSVLPVALPLLLAFVRLTVEPWAPGAVLALRVDTLPGWIATLSVVAALLLYLRLLFPDGVIHGVGVGLVLLGWQVLPGLARLDARDWFTWHAALVLPLLVGSSLLVGGLTRSGFAARPVSRWVEASLLVLIAQTLLWSRGDPALPWWSAAVLLGGVGLTVVLTLWSQRERYLAFASVLLTLVGVVLWLAWGEDRVEHLVTALALILALASLGCGVLEGLLSGPPHPTTSRTTATIALALLGLLVVAGIGSGLARRALPLRLDLAWLAWVLTAGALAWRWWRDGAAPFPTRTLPLYLVGLLGTALACEPLWLQRRQFFLWGELTLAVYLLLAAAVAWVMRAILSHSTAVTGRSGEPSRTGATPEASPAPLGSRGLQNVLEPWFVPVQTLLGTLLALTAAASSTLPLALDERLLGPAALLLLLPVGVLLVRLQEIQTSGRLLVSQLQLRHATLIVGAMAAVLFAWAWLEPAPGRFTLNANILFVAVLAVLTLVYGAGLRLMLPTESPWVSCAARQGRTLGILATLAVLLVLGREAALWDPVLVRTPLATWAIVVVLIALLTLTVSALCFAVLPWSDPFRLPERWRVGYVYAAEVLLVLLLVHLRLTVPEMFGGQMRSYWPLTVMALAFVGLGLGELLTRWRLPVLAEPLHNTGLFLPLLPLLAFWLPLEVERGPVLSSFAGYAVAWFLTACLYLVVALARRSAWWALLAALAGNFGLWSVLADPHLGISFLAHPQLWLIPLALIALVTEQLNRDRLPAQAASALRYLGLLMLYLSSTADLFLTDLDNLAMSLVLAVLSIAGVLLGIMLRVRAFLFAGLIFLSLVIFARIWHAAVNQAHTWVWWVSLIVLGVCILTLFALFEKRRAEMLRLLENLKQWD